MSNTIQIKRSSTSGSAPTAGQLAQGELAVNLADEALYTKDASNAVVKLNAPSIDDKNTGATKHVTIASGGNVGIGTSSPGSALVVTRPLNNAVNLQLVQTGLEAWTVGMAANSSALAFTNSGTERARIDSSGNLLVGTTSASDISGSTCVNLGLGGKNLATAWGVLLNSTSDTGTQFFIQFGRNSAACGSITSTGTNSTSYNTSSDYRLKHDIQPMTGALAKVAALKPVTYKWNADDSDGEGFIAHELAEVVPQCVTGEKNAVDAEGKPQYQGIDTSFLSATLVSAIQEQQQIITALTARVEALEAV
jgi:hypothetical protein